MSITVGMVLGFFAVAVAFILPDVYKRQGWHFGVILCQKRLSPGLGWSFGVDMLEVEKTANSHKGRAPRIQGFRSSSAGVEQASSP